MAHRFMYAKKKKGNEPNITFHHIHSIVEDRRWNGNFLRIVSIDPGKINLAFRIEKRFNNGLVEVEALEKINFDEYSVFGENFSPDEQELYCKCTSFLNIYKEFFQQTHIIIIERQILPNYEMIRLFQHLLTYFTINLRNAPLKPIMMEIEPGMKNRVLGMPKGSNAHTWAIEKGLEILKKRGDQRSIDIIMSHKGRKDKKDDLAVTAIQIEAVFQQLRWAVEPEKIVVMEQLINVLPEPFGINFVGQNQPMNIQVESNFNFNFK